MCVCVSLCLCVCVNGALISRGRHEHRREDPVRGVCPLAVHRRQRAGPGAWVAVDMGKDVLRKASFARPISSISIM